MTTATMPMLETYPLSINMDRRALATAIDTLMTCSQACTACADACLSEGSVVELTKCIRTNLDCADICDATARVLPALGGARPARRGAGLEDGQADVGVVAGVA